MNTFGGVFATLKILIDVAATDAHKQYYGTPNYFIKRKEYIDNSFNIWCNMHQIDNITKFKSMLLSHYNNYPNYRSINFDVLLDR